MHSRFLESRGDREKANIALAIIVAHMRSIQQCLVQGSMREGSYIVVFEEDVEFTRGSEVAFIGVADHLCHMETCPDLIWLTHSTQNMKQLGLGGNSRPLVVNPRIHCSLQELTRLVQGKGTGGREGGKRWGGVTSPHG